MVALLTSRWFLLLALPVMVALLQEVAKALSMPRRARGEARFSLKITRDGEASHRHPLTLERVKEHLCCPPAGETVTGIEVLPRWLEIFDIGIELCFTAIGADIAALATLAALARAGQFEDGVPIETAVVIGIVILFHVLLLYVAITTPVIAREFERDKWGVAVSTVAGLVGLLVALDPLLDLIAVRAFGPLP